MNTESSPANCPQCGSAVPSEAPQGLCPRCVLGGAAVGTEAGKLNQAVEEPGLESVRKAFPWLEIAGLIGRGGMGFVYKARQPELDRWVALKVMPVESSTDPQFEQRFHREARALARLNHTSIVAIYDFGLSSGFCYLLMEFVDGVNLRQAMRAGRFSQAEALAIVPRICDAIQYAHEQGVLHRDIKPENILLDAQGRVKIADFGIAKLVNEESSGVDLTLSGVRLGTVAYMAPEQIEKPSGVDHRADVYSLGVVFYELLTGELPLGRFAPPSSKASIDDRVDEIVMRALAKERELRQQSAGQVKTEVEAVSASGLTQPQSRTGAKERETSAKPASDREFLFAKVPPIWKSWLLLALGLGGTWLILKSAPPVLLLLLGVLGGAISGSSTPTFALIVAALGISMIFIGWRFRSKAMGWIRALGLVAPEGSTSLDLWLSRASVLIVGAATFGGLLVVIQTLLSGLVAPVATAFLQSPPSFLILFVCVLVGIRTAWTFRGAPVDPAIPTPPWMRRAAIWFLVLGTLALIPTFLSWGTSVKVWNLASLALITGLALYTRSPGLRRWALAASWFGLISSMTSLITFPGIPGSGMNPMMAPSIPPTWIGYALLPAIAEPFLHGASLVILLRSDIRTAFAVSAARGGARWFNFIVFMALLFLASSMGSNLLQWLNALSHQFLGTPLR